MLYRQNSLKFEELDPNVVAPKEEYNSLPPDDNGLPPAQPKPDDNESIAPPTIDMNLYEENEKKAEMFFPDLPHLEKPTGIPDLPDQMPPELDQEAKKLDEMAENEEGGKGAFNPVW